MSSYADIASSLTGSLKLTQPPVAITFAAEPPAAVAEWSGASPAGCRFWQEGATRTFATAASDHDNCAIGIHTHGLAMSPAAGTDLEDALKVFADLTYVRPEDVAAIPVLGSKPKFVVYGPLGGVPAAPDVVLLFVRADQTLILSEASQQLEGGLPPAMGRPACAVIPQAANTGRSALSLGCCGARAYLDVLTDDVAIYAVPGATIGAFAERVAALSQANAVLTQFHQIRRRDIEQGKTPSIKDSLAALQAAG